MIPSLHEIVATCYGSAIAGGSHGCLHVSFFKKMLNKTQGPGLRKSYHYIALPCSCMVMSHLLKPSFSVRCEQTEHTLRYQRTISNAAIMLLYWYSPSTTPQTTQEKCQPFNSIWLYVQVTLPASRPNAPHW